MFVSRSILERALWNFSSIFDAVATKQTQGVTTVTLVATPFDNRLSGMVARFFEKMSVVESTTARKQIAAQTQSAAATRSAPGS
jgi:hypothetical protein